MPSVDGRWKAGLEHAEREESWEARMEHVSVRWAMGSNIAFKNKSANPHKHNSAVGQAVSEN